MAIGGFRDLHQAQNCYPTFSMSEANGQSKVLRAGMFLLQGNSAATVNIHMVKINSAGPG